MKGRTQVFGSLNLERFQRLAHEDVSPSSSFGRVQESLTRNVNIESFEVRSSIIFQNRKYLKISHA